MASALDVEAWNRQGLRFFATRIALVQPNDRGARLLVSPAGMAAGERRVEPRRRRDEDIARVDSAKVRKATGMVDLARRCGDLWEVERASADDRVALTLAAILASLALGPIFDPDAQELFGVKTARTKLAAIAEA
jgi:hypothetical protein